jgi:hypothetical protein
MSLIIQYISTLIDVKDLQSVTDPMEMLKKLKEFIVPMIIVTLVNLLFSTILHYYIIYCEDENPDSFFEMVIKSLRYFIPYLIIIIILAFAGSIAIALGVFALIIGAFFALLYVFTLYLFILPVMMIESPNINFTIARTIRLAHREFWTNIGWVTVFFILLIVISVVFSGLILIPFSGSFLKAFSDPGNGAAAMDFAKNPVFIVLSALTNALTFPLMPIFACILYFNAKAGEDQVQSIRPELEEEGKVRVEDLYAKPYSDDHPDNPDKK